MSSSKNEQSQIDMSVELSRRVYAVSSVLTDLYITKQDLELDNLEYDCIDELIVHALDLCGTELKTISELMDTELTSKK